MEMYYVYILESLKSKLHYTGIAKDVEVRLRDHNRGKSKFTKGHLPWKLVYIEGPYETAVARQREKELKRTKGEDRFYSKFSHHFFLSPL